MQIHSAELIDIDPDVVQEPELKDYEFGCIMHLKHFQRLKVPQWSETLALVDGVDICEINISYDNTENSQFSVKLTII